jgi:phage terminase large subunit-like protein
MDAGTQYCRDVLQGKILACKKIQQACQRHLNDLKRVKDDDFPYFYDEAIADKIVQFISFLPDIDTGERITPMPFQKWLVCMIHAWRRKDGGKRWKKGLISMARTNSKTQIDSWLCVYDFFFGTPKNNRQIVCGANSIDQADRLFQYNSLTIEKLKSMDPEVNKVADVLFNEIRIKKSGTFIKRISTDTKGIDSIHATLACLDETHQCTDRSFLSKVSSGMVANEEALLLQSSTAGTDLKVPLYEEYVMISKVLDGQLQMDDYFAAVFEQDDSEEMNDPTSWEKSNPLMAFPPKRRSLTKGIISERDQAIATGRVNAFLVKNMNLWMSAKENSYMDAKSWKATERSGFDSTGRDVFIGLDVSMSNDDVGIVFEFPYLSDDGQQMFHIRQHSFVPTRYAGGIEEKEKMDNIPYRELEKKGECTITKEKSGIINDGQVYDWIMTYVEKNGLKVLGFLYDQWHADKIIKMIENNTEWNLVAIRQGTKSLNSPTRDFRLKVLSGNITHDPDRIMEVAFANAVILTDNNGIKIDKDKNTERIDVVDAAMDAHYQAMFYFEDEAGKSELDRMSDDDLNDFFKSNRFSF